MDFLCCLQDLSLEIWGAALVPSGCVEQNCVCCFSSEQNLSDRTQRPWPWLGLMPARKSCVLALFSFLGSPTSSLFWGFDV